MEPFDLMVVYTCFLFRIGRITHERRAQARCTEQDHFEQCNDCIIEQACEQDILAGEHTTGRAHNTHL